MERRDAKAQVGKAPIASRIGSRPPPAERHPTFRCTLILQMWFLCDFDELRAFWDQTINLGYQFIAETMFRANGKHFLSRCLSSARMDVTSNTFTYSCYVSIHEYVSRGKKQTRARVRGERRVRLVFSNERRIRREEKRRTSAMIRYR